MKLRQKKGRKGLSRSGPKAAAAAEEEEEEEEEEVYNKLQGRQKGEKNRQQKHQEQTKNKKTVTLLLPSCGPGDTTRLI